MIKPGTQVDYQYAKGKFVPAWVVEYVAGRDEGDHRVAGFTNTDQKNDGAGDVFTVWSVVGDTQGSFKV